MGGTRIMDCEESKESLSLATVPQTTDETFGKVSSLTRRPGIRCQCPIWHEALHSRDLGYRRTLQAGSMSRELRPSEFRVNKLSWTEKSSFWPDFQQYMNIVHDYSTRKLSFLGDVSAALAGIISTMSQSFSGGFIYGLLEMFFDVALL